VTEKRIKYTKYEEARIISARALQLDMGAPVLINTEETEPTEIAIEEFRRGVIPITVRRHAESDSGTEIKNKYQKSKDRK